MIIIKFQWLKDYQELEESIAYLNWNINKTKLELIRWQEADLSNVKLTAESKGSNVEKVLKKLESDLKFKEEMRASLILLIDTFKGVESQILKKKYVEGKTLEDIAWELSYSYSYIKAKHAELRRRLDFIDDYEKTIKRYRLKGKITEKVLLKTGPDSLQR